MQRYIEQLIEDLHRSSWNVKKPHEIWDEIDQDNPNDADDISYVEEYVYGKREKISKITGIKRKLLPPPEQLSDEQLERLAIELEKFLEMFHFHLDFPQTYPHMLRYRFIRDFWKQKHVALSFGENHIEFCNYEEDNCPFPGYCNICKETEAQMKYDESFSGQCDIDIHIEDLLPKKDDVEAWFRQKEQEDNDPPVNEEDPF